MDDGRPGLERAAGVTVEPVAGVAAPPGGLSRRAVWLRLAVLAGLLVVLAVVAAAVGLPEADELRADVEALGPAAPLVFVLLYAVATLAPLPKNVLTVVAGLVFGFLPAVLLVLPGALLGALGAFALGRVLGRAAVERFTGVRVARVDALLARRGFWAIVVSRLIPVLPFTGINYAAGLTAIRFRDFTLGTAVGMVPGTVAYAALGAYGTSPTSWPFLVAVGALVLLSAAGALFAHRRRARARTR